MRLRVGMRVEILDPPAQRDGRHVYGSVQEPLRVPYHDPEDLTTQVYGETMVYVREDGGGFAFFWPVALLRKV